MESTAALPGVPAGPLAGVKVLDFGHMVMGPTCGLVLADLGAEVVRIEPPEGDPTRRLKGFGLGFFTFYNRNKSSAQADGPGGGPLGRHHQVAQHPVRLMPLDRKNTR